MKKPDGSWGYINTKAPSVINQWGFKYSNQRINYKSNLPDFLCSLQIDYTPF